VLGGSSGTISKGAVPWKPRVPLRTERHDPWSLATIKRRLIVMLVGSLSRCPCSNRKCRVKGDVDLGHRDNRLDFLPQPLAFTPLTPHDAGTLLEDAYRQKATCCHFRMSPSTVTMLSNSVFFPHTGRIINLIPR